MTTLVSTPVLTKKDLLLENLLFFSFFNLVRVCPGDEILTECNYTTYGSGINKFVHFGEGTNEEMCVGYFSYYPQMVSMIEYDRVLLNCETNEPRTYQFNNKQHREELLRNRILHPVFCSVTVSLYH